MDFQFAEVRAKAQPELGLRLRLIPKSRPAYKQDQVHARETNSRPSGCRVSTDDQTHENQIHEIEAAGFHIDQRRVIAETVSGSTSALERKGFRQLIDRLEWDDVLIVTKLDRLGRNAMVVRATVELLAQMQVRVHCPALGRADLTSAAGKMTMAVIEAVAEFERDLLIVPTQAGLVRARLRARSWVGTAG